MKERICAFCEDPIGHKEIPYNDGKNLFHTECHKIISIIEGSSKARAKIKLMLRGIEDDFS